MPNESVVITIKEDSMTIKSRHSNGTTSIKNTNLDSLRSIFSEERPIETPFLPSQWGVIKYIKKGAYEGYALTTPPRNRECTFDIDDESSDQSLRNYQNFDELLVPIPPLVWFFEVFTESENNKILTHSMPYALKNELVSLNDQVFHAPFPNLGIDQGICWGENPNVDSPRSLQHLPALFFALPFNYDISDRRVNSFSDRDSGNPHTTNNAIDHMSYVSHLLADASSSSKEFEYPYDTLSSTSMTVQTAMEAMLPNIYR